MGSEITAVAAQTFLLECAAYFGKRDTGGEDMAFWANIANQRNCEGIAALIQSQAAEIERLTHEVESAGSLRLRMEAHKKSHEAASKNFLTMQQAANTLRVRAESAEADLASAREALKFYADPKNYREQSREEWQRENPTKDPTTAMRCGRFSVEAKPGFVVAPIYHDGQGNRARAALPNTTGEAE